MNYSQYCYAQSIFSIVFSVFCEHSQNTANNRISNKANVLLLIGFKFSGTRNGAFTQLSQKRKKKERMRSTVLICTCTCGRLSEKIE